MAVLIPALGSCVSRKTSGERRLAERLEQKLEDNYLLWYDVPLGPRSTHPDFCVMHPRRGILLLDVQDWKPSTILLAAKQNWEILGDGGPKTVINPLERDAQFVQPEGAHAGKLAFHWGYGAMAIQRYKSLREGDTGLSTHIPLSYRNGSEGVRTSIAMAQKNKKKRTKNT